MLDYLTLLDEEETCRDNDDFFVDHLDEEVVASATSRWLASLACLPLARLATARLQVMGHPFRFGIQTGPFTNPNSLREFAKKIEGLGYAELFSSDHIDGGGLNNLDPFLPLLVAAEATSTLRFGPLVLNNEFHNPVLLARTAASFDLLSGGRLILGIGTGYSQAEHDAADIVLRAPRDRVARLGESVAALARKLRSSKSSRLFANDSESITSCLGIQTISHQSWQP